MKSATPWCHSPPTSSCWRKNSTTPEFRESLDHALAGGVKRVSRLINQMRFLARDGQLQPEVFRRRKIDRGGVSGRDAAAAQSKARKLKFENSGKPLVVTGDRAALKHALSEIMLNALQANPKKPQIGVKLQADRQQRRPRRDH